MHPSGFLIYAAQGYTSESRLNPMLSRGLDLAFGGGYTDKNKVAMVHTKSCSAKQVIGFILFSKLFVLSTSPHRMSKLVSEICVPIDCLLEGSQR